MSALPQLRFDFTAPALLCAWCTTRPTTETCPKFHDTCRRCHAALRISYPCKCFSLDEARTTYEMFRAGLLHR